MAQRLEKVPGGVAATEAVPEDATSRGRRRRWRNRRALGGGGTLLFFLLAAILAPVLAPHDPLLPDPATSWGTACGTCSTHATEAASSR